MKDYSRFGFREHGVMLYLDKTLYKAFIRLQADKGLGRSYAGLLPFVEGLYRLGYLSKEEYEVHFKKYSQELKETKSLTKEDLEKQAEQTKLKQIEKILTEAYKQWDKLKPSAQAYHLKTAQEHSDLPIAQLILKKEGVSNV